MISMSIVALCVVQFATITTASAAANSDLQIQSVSRRFANEGIQFQTCNNGPTTIKEITFNISSTNVVFDEAVTSIFDYQPTDLGSIDSDTMVWTGTMEASQCMTILAKATETGNVGDTVTTSVTIASAVQADDTVNVDNSGNETGTFPDYTIAPLADIKTEAHIATLGEITPTTVVDYELNVTNIGAGQYVDEGDLFLFGFVLPPDATFDSFSDENTSDALDVIDCDSPGTVGDLHFPGLVAYNDRVIVLCNLSADGGVLPADNTVYPFKVSIVAGNSMANGIADVVGLLEGNDLDTLRLFITLSNNLDPLSVTNNSVFHLDYDPSDLTATVSRCAGQGETTTDGTGCFRLEFNKDIYAPSFGVDDINLGGNGEVDSLTQIDDRTWELRVKNITPGSTLTFLLNLNSIQDLSAQQNATQVLGINTIRYETGSSGANSSTGSTSGTAASGNSASGTLATTGASTTTTAVAAILLIIVGLAIAIVNKKKLKL